MASVCSSLQAAKAIATSACSAGNAQLLEALGLSAASVPPMLRPGLLVCGSTSMAAPICCAALENLTQADSKIMEMRKIDQVMQRQTDAGNTKQNKCDNMERWMTGLAGP